LDWFTEVLKVVCNKPGAGDNYGWACLTLVLASYLLAQKIYDQLYLLMKASKTPSMTMMNMLCLPVTMFFWPWTAISWRLYRAKHPEGVDEADNLQIFAQRPVSTLMLGLPLASINFICIAGKNDIVMHPLMVHTRAWQNMAQTAIEDCVDFAIDLMVILSHPAGEDVSFFWLSFVFSIVHLLAVATLTTKEVKHHEAVGRNSNKAVTSP